MTTTNTSNMFDCNFPEAYDFEFQCLDCGCIWMVNTRSVPFMERETFLEGQLCPVCGGVDVEETDDSYYDADYI